MKQKHHKYVDSQLYPFDQLEKQAINQPVKSPSPDKKRANIITPTKSPQLMEIKRNITPTRLSERKFERTPIQSKPFEQSTRYYTNQDFQQYRSSQKKNQVLEELENLIPQEFKLGNSHLQYRSQAHPTSKQIDYIKLLQQKQRTIKQLHQIIEMINRNNSLDLSNSQLSGTKQKRIFQSSDKTVLSYKQNDLATQKQLKNQVRILTIQNQQLIHMIEKFNDQKKTFESIQQSLKKDKQDYNAHRMKEEILSRQIYEMKESLAQKDEDYEMLQKENKEIYNKYLQLDQQNQKLIKMMKDKQLSDRKYHASLIESSVSQKSGISESQAKEKLSLIKIKEQYNQSLKVFKDTVCNDVEDFMREIEKNSKLLQIRLKEMEEHVQTLEKFKLANENLQIKEKQQSSIMRQNTKRSEIEQLSEIQLASPLKQKHKQIESLLMQKNELYERQLQTERKINREISDEMRDLRIKHEQLQMKYNQLQDQNNEMNIKLKIEMSQSSQNKREQIQDINIAKAQQAEIQKLRSLIKSYEEDFESQKQQLINEIMGLKNKTESYQRVIESQRQQFEQKQMDVQTKISEKESELRRNSSKFQSEIDYLRELISEKQLSMIPAEDAALESQVQSLRQTVHEKELQLSEKTDEIEELRSKERKMQQNQEYMRQEISKLVQNYEKQINILKATLSSQQLRHQQQSQSLSSQIRKLISQSQNTQQILLQSQSNHTVEINQLRQRLEQRQRQLEQRVQQLQQRLISKDKESSELLQSREALLTQHDEMKQDLDRLLNVASEVEKLQDLNKQLKESVKRFEELATRDNETISNQQEVIAQQQLTNQTLRQNIINLQQQRQNQQTTITQLQNQLQDMQQRLGIIRKQSQDQINQKNIEFTVEVQKYQQEKSQYEFIIKQLKGQLSSLNIEIDLVREQSLTYRDGYNELLYIKENNLLNQLYQLRSLVAKNLTGTESQSQKEANYDLGKLYIDYQAKIDENKLLFQNLEELRQEVNKSTQERHLLQEKISFLEKNIAIYQNQLRERKNFCERLINEKTKIEKELLLIKKLKLQSRQEQSDTIKQNLLERVNNIVRLQEKRQSDVKRVVQKRSQSPIRQINSLISKVEEFQTFTTKKVQHEHQ